MLSIKFRNHLKFETKLEVVLKIFKLLGVQKKRTLYYSTYTFEYDEEDSIKYEFIEDGLLNEEPNPSKINKEYITIEANLNEKDKIKVELNPPKARKGVRNCSHIDIYIEDKPNLETYFNFEQKAKLKILLDEYKDKISEFYFYNLEKSLDCYTDFDGRGYEKQNNPNEFSNELNYVRIEKEEDKPKKEKIKFYGNQFMDRVFNNVPIFQSLVKDENLGVHIESGSLILDGEDKKRFLDILRKDMNEFINEQLEKDYISSSFNEKYKKYRK